MRAVLEAPKTDRSAASGPWWRSVLPGRRALPLALLFVTSLALHLAVLVLVVDFRHSFMKYPELALRLLGDEDPPLGIFYSSPAYIALTALFYSLAGPAFAWMKVIQAVVGAVNVVLTAIIGGRVFSRGVGLLAGVLLGLHAPMVLLDLSLLPACWMTFATLVMLLLLLVWHDHHLTRHLCGAGLMCGICIVIRPTATLVLLLIIPWILYTVRNEGAAKTLRQGAAFAGCAVAAVLPVTAYNLIVGGELVGVTATGGWVFFCSNNSQANGLAFAPPPGFRAEEEGRLGTGFTHEYREHELSRILATREAGRELSAREVGRWYTKKALASMMEHPAAWLRLELRKLHYAVHAYESYDTADLIFNAHLMRGLPLSGMYLLMPLALIGILFGRPGRGKPILVLVLVGVLLPLLITYVLARYRIHVVPILAIFASAMLFRLVDCLREKRYLLIVAVIYLGVLPASLLVNIRNATIIRMEEVDKPAFASYTLGLSLLSRGMTTEAEAAFRYVLAVKPSHAGARFHLKRLETDAEAGKPFHGE